MGRLTQLVILLALVTASSFADQRRLQFVSLALHDIVDSRDALEPDALTSDRMVALFEFLRGNGWTAVSLDDVEAAAQLNRPLPERAVLITIDDGYRSVYTRVFPLLLAYRMPALVAIVGSWIESDSGHKRYISWDEAREMQRSGLIEFASHSYDLHHGIKANPQGSELPAGAYRKYDPISGYESEEACRERLSRDLDKSVALMKGELGKAPRAIVWPYGRYTAAGSEAASHAGFRFALTLDSEPADASKPMAIARYLLAQDFDFEQFSNDLRSINVLPTLRRLVRLNPATLYTSDPREFEARLSRAIERVRILGSTSVVIEAAERGADGTLIAAWFPTNNLPVRADVFSRLAWQMHTRAGVNVYGRLSVKAALKTLKNPEQVVALFHDFGEAAPIDGLVVEDVPQLATMNTPIRLEDETPWAVRKRRDAVEYSALNSSDGLALQCFRVVEAARPRLRLALIAAEQSLSPSSIADLTLIATSDSPKQAARLVSRMKSATASDFLPRRLGVWIEGPNAPSSSDLIAVTRLFQKNGMCTIGWSDDMIADKPPAAVVARSVSASSFPIRF